MATDTPAWAEHPELLEYYSGHRNRPEHLYSSERRFLPWLARQADRVLDVGCAAGGFYDIWRAYQSSIEYSGVDVSSGLIAEARRLYPNVKFYHGNCAEGLPFPDRYAAVVQAVGWLHWEPRYERALRELWRLSERYLFFDVRLAADGQSQILGRQQLTFTHAWDGVTTTPYICVEWSKFASLLITLQPKTILGYGYWGKPSDAAMEVPAQICFATFVLEKTPHGKNFQRSLVCLEMPLEWPPALFPSVELLPADRMNGIVCS